MARRKHRRLPPRGAHGQFLKRGSARRRHATRRRRNYYAANPRRRSYRRRARRNTYFAANPRRHYRRRARRNPPLFSGQQIFGIRLADIAYAGGGFLVTPLLEGVVNGFLPVSIKGNTFGRYAVKAASVLGLSFVAKKFISPEAGKYVAIGGLTWLIANLAVEFVPTLFGAGAGTASYFGTMNPGTVLNRVAPRRSLGAGPMLGSYYNGIGTTPAKLPERIDPNARF